jgi:phospholipid/cholesterol/gamma-HCH transport system substrate-binding protein/paraquat-inducible protein B
MSTRANYFKLGIFVILAFTLLVGFVLMLGADALFLNKVVMETYLDQSVQGVEVGSRVKYRGIWIGNVSEIDFTHNVYQLDKPIEKRHSYVRLQMSLDPRALGGETKDKLGSLLKHEIKRGLRVWMASQGLTGAAYLEVDFLDPDRNPPLPIDWTPENDYIPSAQSKISRMLASAEEVFKKLENIDLQQILTNLNQLVVSTTREVEKANLGKISDEAVNLLSGLQKSSDKLHTILSSPGLESIPKDAAISMTKLRELFESGKLDATISQMQKTLQEVDFLLAGKGGDLEEALANLRQFTENLKELAENAKRHPSQLLFGQPPKPEKVK